MSTYGLQTFNLNGKTIFDSTHRLLQLHQIINIYITDYDQIIPIPGVTFDGRWILLGGSSDPLYGQGLRYHLVEGGVYLMKRGFPTLYGQITLAVLKL